MTTTTERMTGMMPAMLSMPMGGMTNGMMMSPMSGTMPAMQMPMGGPGSMMIPRCTIKMEKMTGGMKIMCLCEDKTAAAMLQQMCMMTAGGMTGCCCMMNSMMVCCCNMSMATCKCEMMDMGVMMTGTSGDKNVEKMIQACCDCMMSMMMPGMSMCITMSSMPVCCCVC